MDAPLRLDGQLAKFYDRIRNVESEIDQLHDEVTLPKPSQSSTIFGRAFSICKDTAAVGIQKAAIGKFNWKLSSLHSDIQSTGSECNTINPNQKSLLSLEVTRLQNKVQTIWRIMTTESAAESSEDTKPLSYQQLSSNKIQPDQLLGSLRTADFFSEAFGEYARMVVDMFAKGEQPNISYTESQLPSLLKCYRDIQLANELSEAEKKDMRQMIVNAISGYYVEKKRKEKPDSSNISILTGAALDALFYCLCHKLTNDEEKSAKEQFSTWANKKYPGSTPLELSFKSFVLEDKKSLTEEFEGFFSPTSAP